MSPVVQNNIEDYLNVIFNSGDVLDRLSKDPEAFKQVTLKCREMTDGRVPGRLLFKLHRKVGERGVIPPEVASTFSDDEMLLLYKDMFSAWFAQDGFRNASIIGNPIFESVQQAFSSTAINNNIKCLAWLMQNVNIHDYDNDGLTILHAIENRNPVVLGLIAEYADPELFGCTGSLGALIHPRIRGSLAACQWVAVDIKNKLAHFACIRN